MLGEFVQNGTAAPVASGSVKVPRVSESSNTTISARVGIGGVRSESLTQAGTGERFIKRRPSYVAWSEDYSELAIHANNFPSPQEGR